MHSPLRQPCLLRVWGVQQISSSNSSIKRESIETNKKKQKRWGTPAERSGWGSVVSPGPFRWISAPGPQREHMRAANCMCIFQLLQLRVGYIAPPFHAHLVCYGGSCVSFFTDRASVQRTVFVHVSKQTVLMCWPSQQRHGLQLGAQW